MSRELSFAIDGMTCSSCSGSVERVVNEVDGIVDVQVNLLEHRGRAIFDSQHTSAGTIIDAVESIGFDCSIIEERDIDIFSSNTEPPYPHSMVRLVLSIEGMTCTSCSGSIERLLRTEPGVLSADVNLTTNLANIMFLRNETLASNLCEAVESIGFGAEIISEAPHEVPDTKQKATPSQIPSTSIESVLKKLEITNFIRKSHDHNFSNSKEDIVTFIKSQPGIVDISTSSSFPAPSPSSQSSSHRHLVDEVTLGVTINQDIISIRSLVDLIEKRLPPGSEVVPSVTARGFRRGEALLQQQKEEISRARRMLALSTILTLPLGIIGMFYRNDTHFLQEVFPGVSYRSLVLCLLSSPVLFIMGRQYHLKALKTIMACGRAAIGMDFMISAGTLSAYIFSLVGLLRGLSEGSGCSRDEDTDFFQTSAMLITVMLFGKFLESYGKGYTSSAIHALTSRRAATGRLVFGYDELRGSSVINQNGKELSRADNGRQDRELPVSFLGRGDMVQIIFLYVTNCNN